MPSLRTNRNNGEVISASDLNTIATTINTVLSSAEFSDAASARVGAMVANAGGTYDAASKTISLPGAPINDSSPQTGTTYSGSKIESLLTALLSSGAFNEAVQDVIGALVVAAGGSYDDTNGTVTFPGGTGGSGGSSLIYQQAAQGNSIDNADAVDAQITLANANGGGVLLGPGIHRTTRPFKALVGSELIVSPGAIIIPASGYTGSIREANGLTNATCTDGVLTSGSTTVTSATAAFVAADVGKRITGLGIPDNATITARASATSITISAAATLTGTGVALIVGAALFTLSGKGAAIRGALTIRGGNASTTSSAANPVLGCAIQLVNNAAKCTVEAVEFNAVNGWCLSADTLVSGGLYGLMVGQLTGDYNARGVLVNGYSGNRNGQTFFDHLDFQYCDQGDVFQTLGLNDVHVGKINGSTTGTLTTARCFRIGGDGSSVTIDDFNMGIPVTATAAAPVLSIGETGTPNNVQIKAGVAQGGNNSVLIAGGFNIELGIQASRAAGAGVKVTGGDAIDLVGMTYARNNYAGTAGVGDVEVTSTTAHVRFGKSKFTTPVGTSTSQQTQYIAVLPTTNLVTWDDDNRILGGHLYESWFPSGKPLAGPFKRTVEPVDHIMLAWTDNPRLTNTQQALPTSGRVVGTRIYLPYAATVTNIYAVVSSQAGVGLTTALAGIYNSSGTLVAQTGSQVSSSSSTGSSDWSTVGAKSMPLTTPTVLQAGWYDVALLWAGTTAPNFVRCSAQNTVSINQTLPNVSSWLGDSSVTALPATITKSSIDNRAWWFGLG